LVCTVVNPSIPIKAVAAPNRQAAKAAQIERLFRLAPATGDSLTTNREIMTHHPIWDFSLFYRAGSLPR
jgi:hypothetical protein